MVPPSVGADGEGSMRGLARAGALALMALPPLFLAPAANSADRRAVLTQGADYFGFDYDIRKNVDLNACEKACQSATQCKAFTYNTAARWCFLKSDVGELRSVTGAVSGKLVAAAEKRPDVAAKRVSELSF